MSHLKPCLKTDKKSHTINGSQRKTVRDRRKKQNSARVKGKSRTTKNISMKRSMRHEWKDWLKKRPFNCVIKLKTCNYNNIYVPHNRTP